MRRFETCDPLQFDHANQKLFTLTNKGTSIDLAELAVIDPASGQFSKVEGDPMQRVDLQEAMFSDVDNRLLAIPYYDGQAPRLLEGQQL